jgi:hypothetical protein
LFSTVVTQASEHDSEHAPETGPAFMVSGHHYLPKALGFRAGYAVGSLDAFLLAVHLVGTGEQVHNFTLCKDDWSQHEMVVIVERHMQGNQDERHYSAALLVHDALKGECESQAPPNE